MVPHQSHFSFYHFQQSRHGQQTSQAFCGPSKAPISPAVIERHRSAQPLATRASKLLCCALTTQLKRPNDGWNAESANIHLRLKDG